MNDTHRFTGSLFISGNDGVVINAGGLQVSGSINGSGSLFASLSIDNKDQIVVYDATTKQFFHTASTAIFNTSTDLTIGSPTDGDLDDGLLDFNSGSTTFTDAIDDINEVLAGLAPPAAPGLESIGAAGAAMGTTALLSFGQDNSNSITGVANVEDTPSILGNVDRNGSFVAEGSLTVSDSTPVSSSGVRLGVRGTTQIVSGALNITVGADGEPFINHSASAFNKGETGSLELYVNDTDTPKVTILLSESLAATSSLGSNGEKLSVTETASAHFPATGNSLSVFTHRTGSYFIPTAAQRDGLNYARVIHKHGDGTIKASNYYEWVNDIDGNSNHGTISITNVDLDVETKTGEKYLSGVKYFTSLSAEYRYEVNNFYNNVYPSTSQTWAEMQSQTSWFIGRLNLSGDGIATPTNNTGTGNTISAAAPALGNGAGKQDTKIHVTASITSSHGVSIVGDNADTGLAARIDSITHTYKNSISNANSQTAAGILLDNREDDSESTLNTIENFVSESFRLRSGSQTYSNQTAVSNVANRWNSSSLIAGGGAATDHENSLLVLPAYNDSNTYNGSSGHGQLAYPDGGGSTSFVPNGGDFSGITTNAPSNTADYSGLSGVRTYLRKFKIILVLQYLEQQ